MADALCRTGLYVPGDRPDRFAKAEASGADLVVYDLEDAVPGERKAAARRAVVERLAAASPGGTAIQVRVNLGDLDDLHAVAGLPSHVGVRLPKVENAAQLDRAAALAPDRPLIALIESAGGVLHAAEIAAHPAASQVALGESDLRSDVGGGEPMLDHARLAVLFAARAAGLPAPMGSIYPRIRDIEGLLADTRRLSDLGLFGRMAVHPVQLEPIATVFRPRPEEVRWAFAVLETLGEDGVSTLSSGEMVDPAMRGRAERILRAVEERP